MTNTTLKTKFLSLLIMLTMLVGTMPLSGIVSFAVGTTEATDTSVISLTVGDTTTYYSDFYEAWTDADDASEEAILKLLADTNAQKNILMLMITKLL